MKHPKGFTLIELLVVIAIIGILASIIMVSLGGAKGKSRDSKRMADIKNIQLALSLYYNDNLMYPKNIYASSVGAAPNSGLAGGYLPVVPTDPNQSGTCALGLEPACYRYVALTSGSSSTCNATTNIPSKYHIGAILENSGYVGTNEVNQNSFSPTLTGLFAGFKACSSGFNGVTNNCGATDTNSTDQCYDHTN